MINISSLLAIVCDAELRRQATIAQLCAHVSIATLVRMYALLERLTVQP